MHPRNSFPGFHRANICEFGVENSIIVLRIQCKRRELYCFHILRDTNGVPFLAIINPGQKNIIVGCIYRHPSVNLEVFNEKILNPFM